MRKWHKVHQQYRTTSAENTHPGNGIKLKRRHTNLHSPKKNQLFYRQPLFLFPVQLGIAVAREFSDAPHVPRRMAIPIPPGEPQSVSTVHRSLGRSPQVYPKHHSFRPDTQKFARQREWESYLIYKQTEFYPHRSSSRPWHPQSHRQG